MIKQRARRIARFGGLGGAVSLMLSLALLAGIAPPAMADPSLNPTDHLSVSSSDLAALPVDKLSEGWGDAWHWRANGDGTRTAEVFSGPVFFQGANGQWQPIDLDLSGDGSRLAATAGPSRLPRFGLSTAGDVVKIATATGELRISYPAALSSVGIPSGREVVFPDAFGGGRHLRLDLTTTGYEESVVIPDASVSSYRLAMSMPSGTSAREVGLGIEIVDGSGAVIGTFGDGLASDSSPVPSEVPVWVHLVDQTAGLATIAVSVDPAWLADPARVYPVTIDPSYSDTTAASGAFDGYLNSDNPDVNYPKDRPQDPIYSKQIHLRTGSPGNCEWPQLSPPCTSNRTRTFLHFPITSFVPADASVSAASVSLFNYYSFATSALSTDAYGLAAAPSDTTTWSAQPATDGFGVASSSAFGNGASGNNVCGQPQPPTSPSCGGAWVTWSGLAAVAGRWLQNGNPGLTLYASDEHDRNSYRKYYSAEYGYGYAPRLDVTYTIGNGAPTITSSSHPDQNRWYTSKAVHFTVTSSRSTVTSWSHGYSTDATAEPDDTADFQTSSGGYTLDVANWPEGTQYYAVKYLTSSGWSATSHYRVNVDSTAPVGPAAVQSPSHKATTWNSAHDPTIDYVWNEAVDTTSAVAGYSVVFDQSASTTPDNTVEVVPSGTGTVSYTSPPATNGSWYVHVRAVDLAGNAGAPVSFGPVAIDLTDQAPVIASDTHPNQSAWYADRNPRFSWSHARPADGFLGYSVAFDQSPTTDPDGTVDTIQKYAWVQPNVNDGEWYLHVRVIGPTGVLSPTGHYRVRIDGTGPSTPVVSSSSHPDPTSSYSSNDFTASWTSSDLTGVAGSSFQLDHVPVTDPDTVVDTTANTFTVSQLENGTWYLHVRTVDPEGNWSTTAHFKFTVDVPCASTTDLCGFNKFAMEFTADASGFTVADSAVKTVVPAAGAGAVSLLSSADAASPLSFQPVGTTALLGPTSQVAPDTISSTSMDGTWRRLFRAAPGGYGTEDTLLTAAAPKTFDEHVVGPPGTTLAVDASGRIHITDALGTELGWITQPSAIDATGATVPVTVAVQPGNVVHITVTTTALTPYPVIVDPYRLRDGSLYNPSSQNPHWWFGWKMKQQTQPYLKADTGDPERDQYATVKVDISVTAPNLNGGPGAVVNPRVSIKVALTLDSVASDMKLYVVVRCKWNRNDQIDPVCPSSGAPSFVYDSSQTSNPWRREFVLEPDIPTGPMPSSGTKNFFYEVLVRPAFRPGGPPAVDDSMRYRTLDMSCDTTKCVFDDRHKSGTGA